MEQKKIVCDSDVMIDYWDAKNPRYDLVTSILQDRIGLSNVVLSAITKMELLLGATNKNDLARINKELAPFNISLINNVICQKALSLIQKYSLSHGLTLPDSLIASTAIITGTNLFTYNTKHYKFISDLTLYDPA